MNIILAIICASIIVGFVVIAAVLFAIEEKIGGTVSCVFAGLALLAAFFVLAHGNAGRENETVSLGDCVVKYVTVTKEAVRVQERQLYHATRLGHAIATADVEVYEEYAEKFKEAKRELVEFFRDIAEKDDQVDTTSAKVTSLIYPTNNFLHVSSAD